MIPAPLAAVVFDKDGVLLDTETIVRQAMFRGCAELGYAMEDALHLSLIGGAREDTDARLIAHYGDGFPLDAYRERCRVHFEELCRPGVPVKPGARELLRFLKERGIPRAVATSTRRARSEENLRRSGLWEWIDALVCRDDVAFAKPHPESYLRAAELLGQRPVHCLALEDSYNGIRAAHAAGMATIMIPDLLIPKAETTALCVGIVRSLGDVEQAIRQALSD